MRKMLIPLLLALAAPAAAQSIYRCGNTFSERPCAPDAKLVIAPPARQVDTPPAPEIVEAAKQQCAEGAVARLRDPDSARVGMVYREGLPFDPLVDRPTRSYRVRINAKNAFGGYSGEQTYTCHFDMTETRLISVIAPSR